jgi:hypothetical protein
MFSGSLAVYRRIITTLALRALSSQIEFFQAGHHRNDKAVPDIGATANVEAFVHLNTDFDIADR